MPSAKADAEGISAGTVGGNPVNELHAIELLR
ncbi:hypothetical protein SDC9_194502 [bioreactor metagenome]|uniref:Uncharacterized protein n=1 Tax=bioreactor metagenome TaxID=1076179 RepID=A0A645IHT3_9ZZZZ